MKRKIYYPILFLFVILLIVMAYFSWFSPMTTVLLVRHAERLNSSDTTSLSEAGLARANTLAHVVGSSNIDHIFVTQYIRTQQTAAPIAAALGIAPIVVQSGDIGWLVDSINAHQGGVMLIVGHSDTLPMIMSELGVSSVYPIGGSTFDNLFVVSLRKFGVRMTHLKFGSPT